MCFGRETALEATACSTCSTWISLCFILMCFARVFFSFFRPTKNMVGWMPRCSAACQKRYQTLGTELNVLAVTVVAVPVAWYRLRLLQGLQGMETWKKQRKTDGNKKIKKNGDGPDG